VRRLGTALVGAMALGFAVAPPASADPPTPTNYRSEVLEARPALPEGVELEVVGGDAFLQLTVARGITVVVPDYGEEPTATAAPYLRVDADGTVRRNEASAARAANDDRYGTSDEVPDPDAGPRWTVVGRDGRYAWHDHRIHWMSPRPPRAVAADGTVDLGGPEGRWQVPLVVDGEPVVVEGRLVLLEAPSPVPWALAAAGLSVLAIGLGRARPRVLLLAAALVGAAAIAVSTTRWLDAPAGSGATPTAAIVAAVAVVGTVLALVGPRRARIVATALGASGLLGWALTRLGSFTHAVLPTPWPALDRGVTALAVAAGVALAAGLVVRSSPSA
jgi:hypothetical protein